VKVYKRTFEAKQHPKGSLERAALNTDPRTSEYMTSHKYAVVGANVRLTFRTKTEAQAFETSRSLGR
jgi:hypothetical protein